MAEAGEGWVLLADESPQAVIAYLEAEDGFRLLDFVVAQGEEAWLAWGFARATEAVRGAGRRPAAVIDALDPVRRRILRAAGWYTTAAYMVFYDPVAGRPSVPSVTLQELRDMMARKERFHLVDVMGEEHWKAGSPPGLGVDRLPGAGPRGAEALQAGRDHRRLLQRLHLRGQQHRG